MDIDAQQAQLMAQIIPVFLIALVVDRRAIVSRMKDRDFDKPYKLAILTYLGLMALAMQIAVTHAECGASGWTGRLLNWSFWLSLGGALFLLGAVFWDTKGGSEDPKDS